MNTAVTNLPNVGVATRLRHWLARTAASVREAMELAAWARAQAQLLQFADRCEPEQPALAKDLRDAARHGPLA